MPPPLEGQAASAFEVCFVVKLALGLLCADGYESIAGHDGEKPLGATVIFASFGGCARLCVRVCM